MDAIEETKSLWDEMHGPAYPYLAADDFNCSKAFHFLSTPTDGNSVNLPSWRVASSRAKDALRPRLNGFLPVMGVPVDLSLPSDHSSLVQMKLATLTLTLTADECRADLEWFPGLRQGLDELTRSTDLIDNSTKRRDRRLALPRTSCAFL